MISRIILENFFSFGKKTTIELNPDINILVGINGSGKSNFLKAIKLLYDGVIGEGLEKTLLRDWSGFSTIANFSKEQKDYILLKFEFDRNAIKKAAGGYTFKKNPVYQIIIFRSGNTSYYIREKIYSESIHDGQQPFIFMDMNNTEGVISTREDGSIGFQRYPHEKTQVSFKSTELVLRQISDPDRFYPLFTLKKALEKTAVYNYFDTTLNSPIRQPGTYDTEGKLMVNGQNLMSILLRIKNHHSLDFEKVEKYIQKINPNFKDISFDLLGSKLFLVLREKYLSKSVSIEHISDGTLRYLLLLSILLNPERGSLICIDEPEIGLHPDMINSIAEAVKNATQEGSQMIIATHSPLLLNSFELDEILIFEKDETNQTIVRIKSEDDFKDWNDDYLTGQLWLLGLIGGKRW